MESTDLPRQTPTSKEFQAALDRIKEAIEKATKRHLKLRTEMAQDNRGLSNDVSKLEAALGEVKTKSKSDLESQPVPPSKFDEDEDDDEDSSKSADRSTYCPQYQCNICFNWFEQDTYKQVNMYKFSNTSWIEDENEPDSIFVVRENMTVNDVKGWRCPNGHLHAFEKPKMVNFWQCTNCNEEYEVEQEAIDCCA